MGGGPPGERPPLWIVRYAGRTGMAGLADRLPVGAVGPHLFVTAVWCVDNGVAFLAGSADPTAIWVAGRLLELAGLVLVASTVSTLGATYRDLAVDVAGYGPAPRVDPGDLGAADRVLRRIDGLTLRAVWRSDDEWVDRPAPPRLRRALLACGLLLHATYLFGLGNVEHVLSTQGPISGGLSFFVIIPFVYYPLLAEFVAVVANVHVALPARIRSDRLLDFEDVSGYGGLRPVGRLVETSGHRYVAGLILYTSITIVTGLQTGALDGNAELVAVDMLYLVVGTLVGIALFFYPVFSLHRFMTAQKDARLHAIADEVSRLEGDGATFPEVAPDDPDAATEYMRHFMNMRVLEGMHEYPVRLQQATSVLTGLVVPYVLEYGADVFLSSV